MFRLNILIILELVYVKAKISQKLFAVEIPIPDQGRWMFKNSFDSYLNHSGNPQSALTNLVLTFATSRATGFGVFDAVWKISHDVFVRKKISHKSHANPCLNFQLSCEFESKACKRLQLIEWKFFVPLFRSRNTNNYLFTGTNKFGVRF